MNSGHIFKAIGILLVDTDDFAYCGSVRVPRFGLIFSTLSLGQCVNEPLGKARLGLLF